MPLVLQRLDSWFLVSDIGRQEWESGGYLPEFRRKVLDLVEAGRSVADVAHDLEISAQSIYTSRRQDRVDRGAPPTAPQGPRRVAARPRDRGEPRFGGQADEARRHRRRDRRAEVEADQA